MYNYLKKKKQTYAKIRHHQGTKEKDTEKKRKNSKDYNNDIYILRSIVLKDIHALI